MAPKKTSKPAPINGKPEKGAPAIDRDDFLDNAEDLTIEIDGNKVTAAVKEFSSGSYGFYANGKVIVEINGVKVPLQVSANLVVVNSKPK